MTVRGYLAVPKTVLASARYAPAVVTPGTLRPSGSGMTGADLQLLYVLLGAAELADGRNVVDVPQTIVTAILAREHPERISAALDRLRGTDMLIGNLVIPCVVEWAHVGVGLGQMVWRVRLHRRMVELVKASILATARTEVRAPHIAGLSSRYSLVLYSRWAAMLAGEYPDRDIDLGQRTGKRRGERKRAFDLTVPVEALGRFFGFYDALRDSEIRKFLVTTSPQCALDREMRKASIALDSYVIIDAATDRIVALRVLMSAIAPEGVAGIRAGQKHAHIQADARRAAKAMRAI